MFASPSTLGIVRFIASDHCRPSPQPNGGDAIAVQPIRGHAMADLAIRVSAMADPAHPRHRPWRLGVGGGGDSGGEHAT